MIELYWNEEEDRLLASVDRESPFYSHVMNFLHKCKGVLNVIERRKLLNSSYV